MNCAERQHICIEYLYQQNTQHIKTQMMMKTTASLHEQRKKLNNLYNAIIKRKDLPESEFDSLMRLWISENEKLEEKEQLFEMSFLQQTNIHSYANTII